MVAKSTPEEKLFAVIQGAKPGHPRTHAQAISLASLGPQLLSWLRSMDLPRINRLLVTAAVVLLAVCLIFPLVMRPQVESVIARAEAKQVAFSMPPPLDGLRAPEVYVQTMMLQDPFRVSEPPLIPPQARQAAPDSTSPGAQALLSNLRLVGISWDEEPVAMIENQETQQTNILKTGDALGSFTVKEILEDKVILKYGIQEVELF